MKVEKSLCTHYKIRPNSYRADIFIVQEGEAQAFSLNVISEFGNWDTFWGAPGPNLSQFLISLEMDYVMNRLNANKAKFKRFWEIIWLVFIEELKKEI